MSELILIGGLAQRHRNRVRQFCLAANGPVYAEPLSGLREDPQLDRLLIRNERMLARGGFRRVIRIGNVPTLRFWRDLDSKDIAVIHYSDLPFSGLTRGEVFPIEEFKAYRISFDEDFLARDRQKSAELLRILDAEPRSELAMVRALSEEIPAPDCPPVRVTLMGEHLVAFRDSDGKIGLLGRYCAHRAVPRPG